MKAGDVCIIVDSYHHPEHVGMECTLVELHAECKLPDGKLANCRIEVPGEPAIYSADGLWWSHTAHLRKKPPKETTTTWSEIEKISGWNPIEETVK